VKKPQENLDSLIARKTFLDSSAGNSSSSIVIFKSWKDEWRVVMLNKTDTTTFMEAITNSYEGAFVKVKSNSIFVIIRGAPQEVSTAEIQSCTETLQIRSSRSFRLKFKTRELLKKKQKTILLKLGMSAFLLESTSSCPFQYYRSKEFGLTFNNWVNPDICSQ